MAHFAELDENNVVKQVIVIHNNELLDEDDNESEAKGVEFCQSLFGGNWIQTSYNGNIRKNFAGIGYTYDSIRDAFTAPQPFSSWILNEETCIWEPPLPMPVNPYTPDQEEYWLEPVYQWDESTLSWTILDIPKISDTISGPQSDETDLTEGQN